jgi:hypothetical protein
VLDTLDGLNGRSLRRRMRTHDYFDGNKSRRGGFPVGGVEHAPSRRLRAVQRRRPPAPRISMTAAVTARLP